MRFMADGPDLPGDLLDARDEGQVIFFCGAGVSRAQAGGPSFPELADRVVTALGSSPQSPARQILALSKTIAPMPGVGGILPADRIFALLEQEFSVAAVRRAVAAALRPKPSAGLDPHKSLIELSRTPNGVVRLVTTNFDRVFEDADPSLKTVEPPNLPDPTRTGALDGIIHLHGKVSKTYTDQEGAEFVLSSADFGRAYLADGWATAFMRALIQRYRIVFVGYSADDPPMQYLLEALRPSSLQGRLYALQDGEASHASGLWRHKGVTAIPFNGFPALWATLAAWAERARDPEGWRKSIAAMAVAGPRGMLPHQRGQVAQLVTSTIGAGVFAAHEPAPPAEWLCTFDPYVRYDQRQPLSRNRPGLEQFDPFDSYSLDGETTPAREEERPSPTNTPPPDSWSALEIMASDQPGGHNSISVSLRGLISVAPPKLPSRLWRLARWFGRIATDPVAIWWASGQTALHPDMAYQARETVFQVGVSPDVQRAWRLILAALDRPRGGQWARHELERIIRTDGWSRTSVIMLTELERPRLTVRRPWTAPIVDHAAVLRLAGAEVDYPERHRSLEVPDNYLLDYIDGTRRNLVLATRLEEEVGGYALTTLSSLKPYERGPNEFHLSIPKISSIMIRLRNLVQRLLKISPDLATTEAKSWRSERGIPFRNLRVWAAGEVSLSSSEEAAATFLSLGKDFWANRLERDLLSALKSRWASLSLDYKNQIEAIMLAGPEPWSDVDAEWFKSYRLHEMLRRLHWMRREGIDLSFDVSTKIEELRQHLPSWSAQDADEQLDLSPTRGGNVGTDRSHSSLLNIPLDRLLPEAQSASGRGRDFLIELKPFEGLVDSRPVRALAALRRAATHGEDWKWAWDDLLWSEARASDSQRFRCLLAQRITRLPTEILKVNLRAVVQWFTSHSRPIWEGNRDLYFDVWHLLSDVVDRYPEEATSAVISQGQHDWLTEAINSPGGRLAKLLFDEAGWDKKLQRLDDTLKTRVARLLRIAPGPRAHAIAIIARQTDWFYAHDKDWTEDHLISVIERLDDIDVANAAQSGIASLTRPLLNDLFLRLKPLLLTMLIEVRFSSRRRENLSMLVLAGWFRRDASGARLLSSEELRETLVKTDEEQRLHILRYIRDQIEDSEEHFEQVIEFLKWVWPRQLAVQSSAASVALVEVALHSGARMPEVTAAVLEILDVATKSVETLPYVHHAKDEQILRYPIEHLKLAYALLPEDAQLWPSGIAYMIERLAENASTKNDPHLSDLKRRLART